MSYNNIEKLKGIEVLQHLKVLYLSNNKIADWKQVELLKQLPNLEVLVLAGNPIAEKHQEAGGRAMPCDVTVCA
jgi:dynein light chain 1